MRWIITEPRGVEPALGEAIADAADYGERYLERFTEPMPRCLYLIDERPPLAVAGRLSIYAEGYFARLVEALEDDFKVLRALMDEDDFRSLVADYLVEYPSQYTNIGEAGLNLPKFVRDSDLTDSQPFLFDLVTLEWAFVRAFYADDHDHFDVSALASASPDAWAAATLTLSPSLQRLEVDYPVDLLWTAAIEDVRELAVLTMDRFEEPQPMILFRDTENDLRIERLAPLEAALLKLMAEGLPLGEIFEPLQMHFGDDLDLNEVMGIFSRWVEGGVISYVGLPQS